jgi:hypothetical protein
MSGRRLSSNVNVLQRFHTPEQGILLTAVEYLTQRSRILDSSSVDIGFPIWLMPLDILVHS